MQHDTISTLLTISSEELKKTPLPSISELPSTRVKQVYIIGKSMSCWLTIPSKHISRQHVMIRYDGNGQYSLSSNSKNGTLLNNYRIDGKGWKPLKHHDVIGLTVSKTRRGTYICAYTFLFVTRRKEYFEMALRIKSKPVLRPGSLFKLRQL